MEVNLCKNFPIGLVVLTALLFQITDSAYRSYRYSYYTYRYYRYSYSYRYYRYYTYNTYYYSSSSSTSDRAAGIAVGVTITCIFLGVGLFIIWYLCRRKRRVSTGTVITQPAQTTPNVVSYTTTGAMAYTQPMPPPAYSTLGPTPAPNMSSTQNIQQLSAQNMGQTNGTMSEPLSTGVTPVPPYPDLSHKENDDQHTTDDKAKLVSASAHI